MPSFRHGRQKRGWSYHEAGVGLCPSESVVRPPQARCETVRKEWNFMMNNSSSSCSEEVVEPMGVRAASKSDMAKTMVREKRSLQTDKIHDNDTLIKEIAHDFKNILIIIKGFTELAIESIQKDTKPHLHLQTVIEAASRGEKVVGQMLLFRVRPNR